jgi:hypothetical protein
MSVQDWPVGMVAEVTVDGRAGIRVVRCGAILGHWLIPETNVTVADKFVTDVRPLVVLDLVNAAQTVKTLRILVNRLGMFQAGVVAELADQVEAQMKTPRIPEPGLWGVVEAS